jgi:hypothetical protein
MGKKVLLSIIISLALLSFITSQKPTLILPGTKDKLINVNSNCEIYQIKTNFKHLTFRISQLKNIEKLIFTDELLSDCNVQTCSEKSNICQSIFNELIKNSKDSRKQVGNLL